MPATLLGGAPLRSPRPAPAAGTNTEPGLGARVSDNTLGCLMNRDRKATRRKSMLGTALFAFGILAGVFALITGSVWMVAAAVVLLVPGILMLYQVGQSIS